MGCDDNSVNINCQLEDNPAMGDYTTFQQIAMTVSGVGANVVGKPYIVYRITSTSNGDFIQPANIFIPNILVDREKDPGADVGRETLGNKVYWYKLLGDLTQLLTGDVIIQNDPFFGVGHTIITSATQEFVGLGLAEFDALRNPIAGRLDRNCQVYRAPTGPNADGYYDTTLESADRLVCINGIFTLVPFDGSNPPIPAPVASLIPMGFQPTRPQRQAVIVDVPDVAPKNSWSCYVPSLPGFTFQEGDEIVCQDQSRYRVTDCFAQQSGTQGSQLLIDRYVSQAA